jgi:hypothetical protein
VSSTLSPLLHRHRHRFPASGLTQFAQQTLVRVVNTAQVTLHLDTLKLTRDGVCVGYLHQSDDMGIPVINCDLAGFDRNLKAGMKWTTTRPSEASVKFTTQDAPRAQIDILNDHNPSARSAKVALLDMNKSSTVTATKKINVLIDAYSESIQNALHEKLGLGNVLNNNNDVLQLRLWSSMHQVL